MIHHLINFRADVDTFDAYGGTPLVAAALNGELECVQALTEAGADINHKTTNGNTPLMKASLNGHVKCVRWLMLKGALPSIENKKINPTTQNPYDAKALTQEAIDKLEEKLRALKTEMKTSLSESTGEKKTEHDVAAVEDVQSVRGRATIERADKFLKRLRDVMEALGMDPATFAKDFDRALSI